MLDVSSFALVDNHLLYLVIVGSARLFPVHFYPHSWLTGYYWTHGSSFWTRSQSTHKSSINITYRSYFRTEPETESNLVPFWKSSRLWSTIIRFVRRLLTLSLWQTAIYRACEIRAQSFDEIVCVIFTCVFNGNF